MTIIKRFTDLARWRRTAPWRLVYGRRKVGKSFFVKNETEWDVYYFVTRSRTVIKNEEEHMEYKEFLREFRALLGRERIVVDEFHRLPADFIDFLHMVGTRGELTLITSSKFFARSMLGARSPLLGTATPFELSLISPVDALASVQPKSREEAERVFIAVEPWTISFIHLEPEEMLENALRSVPGLLGEIATEEDRQLTETYDSILEAIAVGENTAGKIASYLASRFPERNSRTYTGYLKVLEDMGIIHRLRIHGKRRSIYVHTSPVVQAYYRIRRRLGFPDFPTEDAQILRACREELPHMAEAFVRRFFAEVLGEPPGVYIGKEGTKVVEVDGYFQRSRVVLEVKWKHVSDRLVKSVYEKLRPFKGMTKLLVVPEKDREAYKDLKVLDIGDLTEMARRFLSSLQKG